MTIRGMAPRRARSARGPGHPASRSLLTKSSPFDFPRSSCLALVSRVESYNQIDGGARKYVYSKPKPNVHHIISEPVRTVACIWSQRERQGVCVSSTCTVWV
jgi:hypothetical protein